MSESVAKRTARRHTARQTMISVVSGLVVCWLIAIGQALAQSAATPEHSVKAAYLLKLPAYVEWPRGVFERADSALTIGVLGADDVADALAAIVAGRTVNGRPIVVRKLPPNGDLAGLNVLYFNDDSREGRAQIAADAEARRLLTVTDSQVQSSGSVIDFVSTNGRVRFEVHLDAANRNGLRLHSGLLDVATRVHGARR